MDLTLLLSFLAAENPESLDSPREQKRIGAQTYYSITQYLDPQDQQAFKTLSLQECTSSQKKVTIEQIAQNFKGIGTQLDKVLKQEQEKTKKEVEGYVLAHILCKESSKAKTIYQPINQDFFKKIDTFYQEKIESKKQELQTKNKELNELKEKKENPLTLAPVEQKNAFLWFSSNDYFSHFMTALFSGSFIGVLIVLSQKFST